jgi:hypothetical protein
MDSAGTVAKNPSKAHFELFRTILRQRRRKTTNTTPTILGAVQASSQSTSIIKQFYSTYVRITKISS